MTRPLALTLGEPAGIGPDITLAAWQRRAELGLPPFYLLADPDFIAERARLLGLKVPLRVIDGRGCRRAHLRLRSRSSRLPRWSRPTPGQPDASSAPAAIASIRRAVADVFAGRAARGGHQSGRQGGALPHRICRARAIPNSSPSSRRSTPDVPRTR